VLSPPVRRRPTHLIGDDIHDQPALVHPTYPLHFRRSRILVHGGGPGAEPPLDDAHTLTRERIPHLQPLTRQARQGQQDSRWVAEFTHGKKFGWISPEDTSKAG
jgi:hypothetical protein